MVGEATDTAVRAAGAALTAWTARLRGAGHRVVAAGVVAGSGSVREELPLPKVLSAYGLLHAAEGELYRDVLLGAAADLGDVVRRDELRRRLEPAGPGSSALTFQPSPNQRNWSCARAFAASVSVSVSYAEHAPRVRRVALRRQPRVVVAGAGPRQPVSASVGACAAGPAWAAGAA